MNNESGFTLIELLIVIAVIAILVAISFVAIDPLTRFKDVRDSTRASDILSILSAIKIDQVDNKGYYLTAIRNMNVGEWYMITNGMSTGCADNDANCDVNVTTDTNCVDLSGLVTEGYLGEIPYSGAGAVTWDSGSFNGNEGTGYVLKRESTGIIRIQSCESENTGDIKLAR